MTMPEFKRWQVVLVAGLIVLTGLWMSRAQLADVAITALMSGYGFDNAEIDIQHLGSRVILIEHIEFLLRNHEGNIGVKASDIRIDYSAADLSKGKIQDIHITTLELNYVDTRPGMQSAMQPAIPSRSARAVSTSLYAEFLESFYNVYPALLFFQTLSIEQLLPAGVAFSVLDQQSLRFKAVQEHDVIHFNLAMNEDVRAIRGRMSRDGLSIACVYIDQHEPIPLSIDLQWLDLILHTEYRLHPEDMQAWLQPIGVTLYDATILVLDKPLMGSILADLSSAEYVSSTINGNIEQVVFTESRFQNIGFSMQLEYSTTQTKTESLTDSVITHMLVLKEDSSLSIERIATDLVTVSDYRLDMAGKLTMSGNDWRYEGSLGSNAADFEYDDMLIQLADHGMQITADAGSFVADGTIALASLPVSFEYDINHDLVGGAGYFTLLTPSPVTLDQENTRLSHVMHPWPWPVDLLAGDIDMKLNAAWTADASPELRLDIDLNDVGGHIGEMVFSGLQFDHEIKLLPALGSVASSEMTLSTIDTGVTVSNIRAAVAVKPAATGSLPKLVVHDIYGQLLGGFIETDGLVYDMNRDRNNFMIKAKDIELAEVVKTQQLKDIYASGKIDGALPVKIVENGVYIHDGSFSNKLRKGIIRYNPEAGTDQLRQNPLTGIALDALKDFQYSELKAGINYQPDGLLVIDLALKGISPALDTDRPVHLNINTEQNLISLLKSIRFAQGVSDSVDKRVRRQYEKRNTIQTQ